MSSADGSEAEGLMPSKKLGLSCALATPFSQNARVDTARLADHARWCLAEGCDSITLFGTTGEGAVIGVRDRELSIKALLDAGVESSHLLSGVTACALDEAVTQARAATDAGLRGLLLTPPFYFRDASDDGLFAWFSTFFGMLASKTCDIYLYHIPSMTGVPLSSGLIGRLKTAFPGLVAGVKDSSGDWSNTETLLAAHRDLQILVGDERNLARAVRQGGAGTICGLANVFPALLRKAAHDGIDDPRIAAAVAALMRYPFMPAIKTVIAHYRDDPGWRVMAPPLLPLDGADARRLIADFATISAKAA
jgi:4-hydroxy-tetrahydrodipicolinate synthase